MKLIKSLTLCALLAFGGNTWASDAEKPTASPEAAQPVKSEKPIVQLALLLDTSGSMNGLINQAKSQLWKVVNEFALAERNGQKPELQVALYEYGNDKLSANDGFIRQIVPLTNDLDKVSEELFKLSTSGGEEYCGKVIQTATSALAWSAEKNAYKAIFIAGNEPFSQGPVNYSEACKGAIQKGILINTIHCGSQLEGVNGKWQDGAVLADGKFLNIDQNQAVAHVNAPQDAEIATLGVELNKTYVRFGVEGGKGAERQEMQDKNAVAAAPGANVQRAVSKASAQYCNDSWDAVDALKTGKKKLEDFKEEELPEEMKKLSKEERKTYIEKKTADREVLTKKITELNDQRRAYVTEELKKKSGSEKDSLDSAMIKVIREQGEAKALNFK